jgi:hypothetical protein
MAFRFTWTCRPADDCLDLYAPGVTKIEYEIEYATGNVRGSIDGDTLVLHDPGVPIWIQLYRGYDCTKWIPLTAGFGDSFVMAAQGPRFELGV